MACASRRSPARATVAHLSSTLLLCVSTLATLGPPAVRAQSTITFPPELSCESDGAFVGECNDNSTMAPSWCRKQNALIVPQPPSVAGTNLTTSEYERVYRCVGDGPDGVHSTDRMADCSMISYFGAMQFPIVDNTTKRLVVMARRTSPELSAYSRIDLLDDQFRVIATPLANYPGIVSHLTKTRNKFTNDMSKIISIGTDIFNCTEEVDGVVYTWPSNCLGLMFLDVDLNKLTPPGHVTPSTYDLAQDMLFQVQYGGILFLSGQFVWVGDQLVFVSLSLSTPDVHKVPSRAHIPIAYFVSFTVMTYNATDPVHPYRLAAGPDGFRNSTWVVTGVPTDIPPIVNDRRVPPIEVGVQHHYFDCNVTNGPQAEYGLGGFFSDERCKSQPVVMISHGDKVVLRGIDFKDHEIDLQDDTIDSQYFAPPAGWALSHTVLFGEQLPPTAVSNVSAPVGSVPDKVSQTMYLTASMSKKAVDGSLTTRVAWSRIPEFAAKTPAAQRSWSNPAGADDAKLKACGANRFWSPGVEECVSRTQQAYEMPGGITQMTVRWRDLPDFAKEPLVKSNCTAGDGACLLAAAQKQSGDIQGLLQPVQAMLPALSSATSGGGGGGSTPQSQLNQYKKSSYGLRHVLFASTTEETLLVFHAQRLPEGCGNATLLKEPLPDRPGLDFRLVNVLSLLGSASHVDVTDNGQYAFTSVTRPRFVLDSMERIKLICETLADDPTNPFLAPYKQSCDSSDPLMTPRLPAIADFMQIASACLPGMYCPSFEDEVVDRAPDGWHAPFKFDLLPCPKGQFCAQGVAQDCPRGFVCPDDGMALPQQCDHDSARAYNCFATGLQAYQLCENGTLCGVPYMPQIPAPPGTKMANAMLPAPGTHGAAGDSPLRPVVPNRVLEPCPPGEWCGLGRSEPEGYPALLCPQDTYCADSQVLTPTVCDQGGKCHDAVSCVGNMSYCPAGTVVEQLCPAGHYCPTFHEHYNCSSGSYCPAGSPIWEVCPARSYCTQPNGADKFVCPDDYYCPSGSIEPISCNFLSDCHCAAKGGCMSPANYISIPVIVLVPLVLWLGWKVFKKFCIKRRHDRRDQMLREHREQREGRERRKDAAALQMHSVGGVGGGDLSEGLLASGGGSDEEGGGAASASGGHGDGGGAGEGGMSRKDFTIDISFENLGLKLKGKNVNVMEGVYGQLRHGRVTAVMGPSGAGKSTLVTTVAGKAYYGETLGTLKINGTEKSLAEYSRLVGFVPQEDIMLRDLTVEENLIFAARTRLPTSWTDMRKLEYVDMTLGMLGLRDIKDSKIGDENVRGISGGQRKRVNIGMELVADPTVLFLDEPTSGLDSTSSMEVCGSLRKIAELGITVVTVIHQPRYEIFTSFHDVCLLAKGGKLAYLGPSGLALDYFESLGLTCPPRVNPPDFFLDCLAGDVPDDFRRAHPDFKPTKMVEWWSEHRARIDAEAGVPPVPDPSPPSEAERRAVTRHSAGLVRIAQLSLKRAMVQHSRHKKNIAMDIALVFVASIALAAVYFGTDMYKPPLPIEVFHGCSGPIKKECQLCLSVIADQILNRASMVCIALGLVGVASMIRIFGAERVMYFREASGLPQPRHTFGYFLGKDLSMIPEMVLAPFFFNLIYNTLNTPRAAFSTYYWIMLGMYFTSVGYAHLVAVVAPSALAQLLGVVAVFGNAMVAGGAPPLKQMEDKFFPLNVLPSVSYIRYALEAMYVGEVVEYKELVTLQGINLESHLEDTFGYDIGAYGRDVACIFLIGVVVRVMAVVIMWLKDKNKKL